MYYWHVHTRQTQFTPPASDDEDEDGEDEEDESEDEDLDELDDTQSRFPAGFRPMRMLPVVPLRELPAGVEVYVRSLCERAAPPSSWTRAVTAFYGPLYLAVTCSILFLPEEYRVGLFWVISSGIVSVCYTPLVRHWIHAVRQSTRLFGEFLALRVFLWETTSCCLRIQR